jgi:hypothetical protein
VYTVSAVGLPSKPKPKKEAGTTDPRGVPLELRLVAKKAKYTLDLGGKTGKEFRKQLEEAPKTGNALPAPPAVDFTLELRNTGKNDLQIHVEGDNNPVTLEVKGKGAVNRPSLRAVTADFRLPRTVTIAAGKSYSFPAIKALSSGHRGVGQYGYWTEAGEYTVRANFRTAVSPAPKDAKDAGNGFGHVTVTSAPVKIKVTAK